MRRYDLGTKVLDLFGEGMGVRDSDSMLEAGAPHPDQCVGVDCPKVFNARDSMLPRICAA